MGSRAKQQLSGEQSFSVSQSFGTTWTAGGGALVAGAMSAVFSRDLHEKTPAANAGSKVQSRKSVRPPMRPAYQGPWRAARAVTIRQGTLDVADHPKDKPRMYRVFAWFALSVGVTACASSSPAPTTALPDAGADAVAPAPLDSGTDTGDAAVDADKSAPCAKTFGAALTNAFGRLDGTVVAVVPPNDQMCALPNATHLIVQVAMQGAVYRMVVDVLSNRGSADVLFHEMDAPLAGGAWSEGWHPGVVLDYVTTLNVHSGSFAAQVEKDLVATITRENELGAHVSIFATSAGEPNSAHLVHRNLTGADGAIVLGPDSAKPHYLLLRFNEQSF